MPISNDSQPAFEKELLDVFRGVLSVICLQLSAPLYLIFWIADLSYAPEKKWLFLSFRAALVLISLVVYPASKRVKTLSGFERLALCFGWCNGFFITLMIYLTEGMRSPYYAGLNLVLVGFLAFLPLRTRILPRLIGGIFIPYYLAG